MKTQDYCGARIYNWREAKPERRRREDRGAETEAPKALRREIGRGFPIARAATDYCVLIATDGERLMFSGLPPGRLSVRYQSVNIYSA